MLPSGFTGESPFAGLNLLADTAYQESNIPATVHELQPLMVAIASVQSDSSPSTSSISTRQAALHPAPPSTPKAPMGKRRESLEHLSPAEKKARKKTQNRDASQARRDNHKEYRNKLEKGNNQLKMDIENLQKKLHALEAQNPCNKQKEGENSQTLFTATPTQSQTSTDTSNIIQTQSITQLSPNTDTMAAQTPEQPSPPQSESNNRLMRRRQRNKKSASRSRLNRQVQVEKWESDKPLLIQTKESLENKIALLQAKESTGDLRIPKQTSIAVSVIKSNPAHFTSEDLHQPVDYSTSLHRAHDSSATPSQAQSPQQRQGTQEVVSAPNQPPSVFLFASQQPQIVPRTTTPTQSSSTISASTKTTIYKGGAPTPHREKQTKKIAKGTFSTKEEKLQKALDGYEDANKNLCQKLGIAADEHPMDIPAGMSKSDRLKWLCEFYLKQNKKHYNETIRQTPNSRQKLID